MNGKKNFFSLLTPNSSSFLTQQEIFWLASHALGLSSSQLMTRENFSSDEISKINSLLKRREAHEPLQYIMGVADFYGRDFEIGSGVLIPRQDTETLIEAVKKIFSPEEKFIFLDWGTGSGCIAITLLLEFQNSFAYMLEASPSAMFYAEKNLSRFYVRNRAEIKSSLNLHEKNFDLIISNPPYISSGEIENLMPEVRDYEPLQALDGGEDGMDFYKLIFSQAKEYLKPGGFLIFEAGNAEQVRELKNFDENFVFTEQIFDAGNFPRALIFRFREQNMSMKFNISP